jgi:hypothetical protein
MAEQVQQALEDTEARRDQRRAPVIPRFAKQKATEGWWAQA